MLENLLNKHVTLCMVSGTILEGYISKSDDKFFELTETDNTLVVVRKDDISFARIGTKETPAYAFKYQESEPNLTVVNDNFETGKYRLPTFVRATEK